MINVIQLEKWYLKNKRDLPFRNDHNPYHIWISEIMLQQTQVETVVPYFERFIKTFPTIKALSETKEVELFSLIQGLGYYRRFKNLHKSAKIISKNFNGVFPNTYEEIMSLPGIGEYTAGAIMSIAYNKSFAATDGNVIRVISRNYGIEDDMRIEKHKKQIKKINQNLIEKSRPRIFTQAIMELGALICKPKNPQCEKCPIKESCKAYLLNKQSLLPYLSKKKAKKIIHYQVFFILDGQDFYLRKRQDKLLGGMYELPQFQSNDKLAFQMESIEKIGLYKHVFTHLVWEMTLYKANLLGKALDDWVKVSISDLDKYPMAVAHKKLLAHLNI